MKSMFMNYFKEGKLYQWDEGREIYLISPTEIQEEFCLDKNGMDTFLKFQNPTITLGSNLVVKSGKTKANIKLYSEQLNLPELDFIQSFKVDVDKLKVASKFVDKTGNRPILTGVNINDGFIVATDSYAMYRTTCEAACNLIVSTAFIKAISHLNGELEFNCNDKVIACEVDGVTYIGRLLTGNYPDTKKLLDGAREKELKFSKQELKSFLSYANGKAGFIIFSNNKLVINDTPVKDKVDFETELELPIDITICVDLEKLSNAINGINVDEIVMEYQEPLKPILLNKEFLVCPCRIMEA